MSVQDALAQLDSALGSSKEGKEEAPKGMAQSAISQLDAGLSQDGTPPQNRPIEHHDSFEGVVKNLAAGGNQIAAHILGLPGTLGDYGGNVVQAGLKSLFGEGTPLPGDHSHSPFSSEGIQDVMGKVGADPRRVEANTALEKGARIGGETAIGTLMGAPLLRGLHSTIQAGRPVLRSALDALASGIEQAPVSTSLSAIPGGMAGETAKEEVPEGRWWSPYAKAAAEMGGNIAGSAPVIGGAALIDKGAQAASAALDRIIGARGDLGKERAAGKQLREAVAGDVPGAIGALDTATPEAIPGSRPTAAQLAQDEGLTALEQQRVPEAERLARSQEQGAAQTSALNALQPTGDVKETGNTLSGYLATIEGKKTNPAPEDIAKHLDDIANNRSPEEIGSSLRTTLEEEADARKEGVSAIWDKLPMDNPTNIGNIKSAAADIQKYIEGPGKFGSKLSQAEKDILDNIEGMPSTPTFEQIKNFRSDVTTALREGNLSDASRARLSTIKKAIDKDVGGSMGEADLYLQARQATRKRKEDFFEGPVAPILAPGTSGLGGYKYLESDLPRKYFTSTPAAEQKIGALLQSAGAERAPVIAQDLSDYALDDLRNKAMKTGTLNEGVFNNWLLRNKEGIDAIPGLRDKVKSFQDAQQSLTDAVTQKNKLLEAYQDSAARFFLKDDPQKAIERAFTAPEAGQTFSDLVKLTQGNAAALGGLKRGIIDHILNKFSQGNGFNGTKLQEFIGSNQQALESLFGKDGLKTMNAIGLDLERMGTNAISNKPLEKAAPVMESLIHGLYLGVPGAASGAIGSMIGDGGTTLIGTGLGVMGGEMIRALHRSNINKVEDLVRRAMMDPKLAHDLMIKAGPTLPPELLKRIMKQLIATESIHTADSAKPNNPYPVPYVIVHPQKETK